MNQNIKDKLKTLTKKPGVYIMKDKNGTVIYVGKAKNLKNRVSQYFTASQKPTKVQAMVDSVSDFDYFIASSEMDALALESNLIKKYQPFYNILLKDGKQFPYIKINLKNPFPYLEIVRKVKKDGAKYFGPYFAGLDAHEILKTINSAFKIRTCSIKIDENKFAKRECLNYSLGLCSAPCTNRISKEDYKKELIKVINFLNGNDEEIEKILTEKMENASKNENFEQAIIFRDRLKMVNKLKQRVIANLPKNIDKDIISMYTDGLSYVICVMIVRGGKILGVLNYPCINIELSEEQTLFNFLIQFYQNVEPANEIVISHNIPDQSLFQNYIKKKINFIVNPHGINKKLIEMARENAKEYLEKHLEKEKLLYNNTIGAITLLKEKLSLRNVPNRIECYDISNISGTNKVCSMVVFKNGQPSKKDYRKFKIKTVRGSNDFASLKEALSRRLIRLEEKKLESFKEKPDLIIIDGGKGQLSSTFEVLKNFSFNIDIISLAKRIEEVFLPKSSVPILLKPGSAELKLLQRIRDEAHRFAITFHRQIRTKAQTYSELENISGVGPKTRDLLLKVFGSTSNVSQADISELESVKGINHNLASTIFNYFHKQ